MTASAVALTPEPDEGTALTLRAAWLAAGGTPTTYHQRPPLALSEYEEAKLTSIGVDLSRSRPFFTKAKALMGERTFELFAASEAERHTASNAPDYGGLKPQNPTGLIIRLVLHRISEQKEFEPMPTHGRTPDDSSRASIEVLRSAPAAAPLPALSPTKHARVSRQIALYDKVHEATGELQTTDVVYCSSDFVVASLPHSDPGTRETWSRTNGKKVLTVRSGWDEIGQRQFGLPYGSLPRLMFYFVESEVIRKGEQKVCLGDSLYMFMQSLGISDSAPNYRAMRTQAARLFNASFQITERKSGADGNIGVNIKHVPPIATEAEFWWHPDRKAAMNGELFSSYIILDDRYFKGMLEHGFPLDSNAVKFLRQSSLELDLYAWVCHRNYSLNRFGTAAAEISYAALMEQFGSEYARARDFRAKLKQAVGKIADLWRGGLEHEFTKNSLILRKSPLQIKASR